MSINSVTLSGHLTRDLEIKQGASGFSVGSTGIAVNERHKNSQTGAWEDVPNFFNLTFFGTRAEKLAQYLTKGTKVAVNGHLRSSSYEKDGQKRTSISVIVEEVEFLSSRDGSEKPAFGPSKPPAPMPEPAVPPTYYQAPQKPVQAPPEIQKMVADAFRNPHPGNSPADVWAEDIPF